MSKVRVCFLGTSDFSVECLRALIDDEHFEVVGVVTQPDRPAGRKLQLTPSPVKAFAVSHGLRVVTPESLKSNPLMVDEILRWGAEVGVVVAFGQILQESFMESFPLSCVNVHASLLPRWRGAAPIQRAIEAGDEVTGVCLQKMVKKLDAGDVIGERRIAIDPDMNSQELHDKLAFLGADLLRVELMDYVRGNLAGHPQDESQVTYARKIEKNECALDWREPAMKLHNKVRAFVWGPGAYVMDEGKRLKIHRTKFVSASSDAPAGTIVAITPESFSVATGQGVLEILEVQPESRTRMSAGEYARQRNFTTTRLIS